MAFSVTVLGSGSSGNAMLLCHSQGMVLVDAGLSGKETCRRLSHLGIAPEKLSAIVISHEHQDHTQGLRVLGPKHRIPIFISDMTLEALGGTKSLLKRERIESGCEFEAAGMSFLPFAVPHDAADPMGFAIRACGQRLGIALDLGYISALVKERLLNCDGLILESNHDLEMLKVGPYPWALKQRVMSRQGHLSNEAVANFLREDFDGQARFVCLAHLSKNNNHPDLARLAASEALRVRQQSAAVEPMLILSYQDRISETMHLD